MPDRYFQLLDTIGLNAEQNPEPIHEIGIALAVPTVQGGDIVDVPQRVTLKPIPGTRTVKVDDPLVAAALATCGQYEEVDAPRRTDIASERKVTQDAREQAGTFSDEDPSTVNPSSEA